jgi:hypothetical protein
LRSKQAERAIITRAIKTSIDEYLIRHDTYPNGNSSSSYLWGYWAPNLPATSYKRPFKSNQNDDWGKLNLQILGNVYHSYYLYAYLEPSVRYSYVERYADLDGDGRTNFTYEYWYGYLINVGGRNVWNELYTDYDDFPTTKTF